MQLSTSDDILIKNIYKLTGVSFLDAEEVRNNIKTITRDYINKNLSIEFLDNKLLNIIDYYTNNIRFSFHNLFRDFDYIDDNFILKNIDSIKINCKIKDVSFTEKDYINAYKIKLIEDISKLDIFTKDIVIQNSNKLGYCIALFAHKVDGYLKIINKRYYNYNESIFKNLSKDVINARKVSEIKLSNNIKEEIKNHIINELNAVSERDMDWDFKINKHNIIDSIKNY